MFGGGNPLKRQKHRAALEVELHDGEMLLGNVFLSHQERVSDLLNDARSFLPLEIGEGEVVHIAKETICRVIELKRGARPSTEAYDMLGVSTSTSEEALRQAYLEMIWANHPERWLGVGLPNEALDALYRRLALVNSAYNRIRRHRKTTAAAANDTFGTTGVVKEFLQHNPDASKDIDVIKEQIDPNKVEAEVELLAQRIEATLEEAASAAQSQDDDYRAPLQFNFRKRRSGFGRKAE